MAFIGACIPACSGEGDRPPRLGGGCGDNCAGPTGVGAGGARPDGTGGSPSGGQTGEPVTISGPIRVFSDLTFASGNVAVLDEVATVTAEGADGGIVTTEFESFEFALDDVRGDPSVWLHVAPEVDSYLPTVNMIDASNPDGVDVYVVNRSAITSLLSILAVPVTLDEADAQLVVQVLDSRGTAVSGVSGALTGAETTAYSVTNTWSDVETQTDNTGRIFFGNVPTSSYPGGSARIQLSGSVSSSIPVQLMTGAVTYVEVVGP